MPSSPVQLLAERRMCAKYPPDTAQRIKTIRCGTGSWKGNEKCFCIKAFAGSLVFHLKR